jgi:hypothetical protein
MTATSERIVEVDEVKIPEPLWSVKSRVSWGALLAGAVVAIALYSLLSLFGVALGVTLRDRFTAEQLGTAATIWTFVTLLLAMFIGGWVSTRATAGEFRNEAMLYGVIVWGVTSLVLIPLSVVGIGTSVGTVLASQGIAKIKSETVPVVVSAQREVSRKINRVVARASDGAERASRSSSEEKTSTEQSSTSDRDSSAGDDSSDRKEDTRSDQSREDKATASRDQDANSTRASSARPDSSRESVDSENNKTSTHEKLVSASWWAFGGTLASLLAAVIGAAVGPTISVVRHKVPVGRASVATAPIRT